jgi:hypothetical protein
MAYLDLLSHFIFHDLKILVFTSASKNLLLLNNTINSVICRLSHGLLGCALQKNTSFPVIPLQNVIHSPYPPDKRLYFHDPCAEGENCYYCSQTTTFRAPQVVGTHKWLSLIFISRDIDNTFNHRHIVSQVIICVTTSIQQKTIKWYVVTKHLLPFSDFLQHRSRRNAQNWRLVIIWRLHHIRYEDQVCRQSRAAITTFLFCRSC